MAIEEKKIPAKTIPATTKPAVSSSVAPKKEKITPKPPTVKPATDNKEVTEVKASANYLRMSPRKVRLAVAQLKGMPVQTATSQLQFIKKLAIKPVAKLLQSAVANAEHNFGINKQDLFIKSFTATDGPTMKGYAPRAHGRSVTFRKRTAMVDLVLRVKPGAAKAVKKTQVKEEVKVINPDEIKKDHGHNHDSSGKPGQDIGKSDKGFMKGIFQRKTG